MRKLLFIAVFFPALLHAQSGVRLGYAGGYANPGDFNKILYLYNQMHDLDRDMPYLHFYNGLSISYFSSLGSNIYYELRWHNRHAKLHSEGSASGTAMQRGIKFRQNFLSAGFYGGKEYYFGLNMDVGGWKAFTRVNTKDAIKKTDWTKIFIIPDQHDFSGFMSMQIGFTAYAGFEKGPVGGRFFIQYQFMQKPMDDIDNALLGGNFETDNYLTDKFNNIGAELYIKLGGWDYD